MTIDSKLLIRIVLLLLVISALVWWLRVSVVTIHFNSDYVHAKCCATHGGCEDKEKCASGTASCCSNKECGKCCGGDRDGIPVCRATKAPPKNQPTDSADSKKDSLTQSVGQADSIKVVVQVMH